jgi:hypothetical protein
MPQRPPEFNYFRRERRTTMLKLALRYARYIVFTLTTVGFTLTHN